MSCKMKYATKKIKRRITLSEQVELLRGKMHKIFKKQMIKTLICRVVLYGFKA